MAIEHARVCGSCEMECPSWADRCPACGQVSMIRRIVIIPPAAADQREPLPLVVNSNKARSRGKARSRTAEPAVAAAPTRSTA